MEFPTRQDREKQSPCSSPPISKASIHPSFPQRWKNPSSPQAVCLTQELCWVTCACFDAQKHFQCHDPTSYPKSISPKPQGPAPNPAVHPFVQHFAVFKPARQPRGCTPSQQLLEEHFQRFLFLFFISF